MIIFNITHSITILTDGCTNFRKFLVEGTKPNLKQIAGYVESSLMLVTALAPVIGYDKASKIAHYAMDNELTLKAAALKLGYGQFAHQANRNLAMLHFFAVFNLLPPGKAGQSSTSWLTFSIWLRTVKPGISRRARPPWNRTRLPARCWC